MGTLSETKRKYGMPGFRRVQFEVKVGHLWPLK